MSNEYLIDRDNKNIAKAKALLNELPPYVKQFYDAKKSAKKELTRYAYVQDIKDFLSYLAQIHHKEVKTFPFELLGELTVQDIDEYKNVLLKDYASSSVKRKLASLSTFFKYMVLAGFIKNNPAAIIDWPAEDKSKAIIYLDNEQTAKLLEGIYANNKQIFYLSKDGALIENQRKKDKSAIKGTAKNKYVDYIVGPIDDSTRKRRERVRLRNYCIVLLFLKTGMRVSELVSIDLDDINFKEALINITGKGGKTRPVSFDEDVAISALRDYISTERKSLTAKKTGEKALFVSMRGSRMTVRQVENIIKEMVQTYLADDETLRKRDFSPHKLRSTCATRLLKETGNVAGVADYLGHDSPVVTTKHYAAIVKEANAKEMGSKKLF